MQPKELKNISGALILLAVFVSGYLIFPGTANALGISPPWVKIPNLLKGSHAEKIVTIVQGDPKEPLNAKLEIIVPEKIRNWITVSGRGISHKAGSAVVNFTIPQVRQFPITVIIDVPDNADLGRYTGEISIITTPEIKDGSQVSIGIGVVIELDLEVTEQENIDYTIPLQKILPMEEGWPVKVSITIDNKGNGRARPKKVLLTVYKEIRGGRAVGTFEDTDLPYVESFGRGETIAEFPVNLEVGSYWAKVTVYKTDEEKIEYESPFEVLPRGTLPQPPKPWWFWASIGFAALISAALAVVVIKIRRRISQFFSGLGIKLQNVSKKFKKMMMVLKEKEREETKIKKKQK